MLKNHVNTLLDKSFVNLTLERKVQILEEIQTNIKRSYLFKEITVLEFSEIHQVIRLRLLELGYESTPKVALESLSESEIAGLEKYGSQNSLSLSDGSFYDFIAMVSKPVAPQPNK